MGSQKESNVCFQSLSLLERFANYISREMSDENNAEILKELPSQISHFCTALEYNAATNKVFREFTSIIDSSLSDLDYEKTLAAYDNKIDEIDKHELLEKCEKYKELSTIISIENKESDDGNVDDDIVTVAQNINHIDPITKLPIVEPVKNAKCGHIYEKNSILTLIKMNRKIKCPIAGCVATEWVHAKDLVSDYALKRMLSEKVGDKQ